MEPGSPREQRQAQVTLGTEIGSGGRVRIDQEVDQSVGG